jgi:multidrug efflux pump subunit AcrA (membrane-fusion protein)
LRRGAPAEVTVSDIGRTIYSMVSLISQSVDPRRLGFIAEIKVPFDPMLKPNQSAKVRIVDYSAPNAMVIPISVIQSDEAGKYVYVLEKLSNGKSIAKKKPINIGEVYGTLAEVRTGLKVGELLITEGHQNIYEGQTISSEIK